MKRARNLQQAGSSPRRQEKYAAYGASLDPDPVFRTVRSGAELELRFQCLHKTLLEADLLTRELPKRIAGSCCCCCFYAHVKALPRFRVGEIE